VSLRLTGKRRGKMWVIEMWVIAAWCWRCPPCFQHPLQNVGYREKRGLSKKTWVIEKNVGYREKRGLSRKTWVIEKIVGFEDGCLVGIELFCSCAFFPSPELNKFLCLASNVYMLHEPIYWAI
jgi:hypothetical protein